MTGSLLAALARWFGFHYLSSPGRPRRGLSSKSLHCELLENRTVPTISAAEQLFIYDLNMARHNPAAYAQQQNLPVSLAGIAAQPPLAVNADLTASAEWHANDMATRSYFSHNTPDHPSIWPNRMAYNFGYQLPSWWSQGNPGWLNNNYIESIAAGTNIDTASTALNLLLVDAGENPPGHRIQLLALQSFYQDNREIGVGFASTATSIYTNYWSAQLAYTNASDQFITGVVYNDTNGNGRHDLNEGLAGVTVSANGVTTSTNAQGGWALPISGTPTLQVTASSGTFAGTATATLTLDGDNREIDFISGNASGVVDFGGLNHAPVLNPPGQLTLPSVAEDHTSQVVTVATLAGAAISDVDAGALQGVAIVGADGRGTWQYSTNAGRTWRLLGNVAETAARLLRSDDRIRFRAGTHWTGTADITFHAWDRTSGKAGAQADLTTTGTGGSTSFSTATATAQLVVTPVNHAPVLRARAISSLPSAVTSAGGFLVADLLGSAVSDADAGALRGLAVTGLAGYQGGTWQFAINGGPWTNFGSVSASKARLLTDSDQIRFVPNAGYHGPIRLTFHAWDETGSTTDGGLANLARARSTGASTPFSSATATARLSAT
jgi:hypothetical protein